MELRRFIYATAVAIFFSIYFPQKRWVLRSQPERYAAKRLRVLCLHYFLDKDFVQLDPATAAQLILAAERLRSWGPLRYSIFTIYFHFQSNSNFPAELFDSINLCFLLLTTTLVHISYLCVCPQTGQVHLFLWYT